MAFKNFDVAKKYAIQEDKPVKPAEPAGLTKKPADEILIDKNGVPFLQTSMFKIRKDTTLNIRITAETKANIDFLSKKFSISQSDLITALVNEAMKKI
jgi:hypothetical protein